MGCFHALAGHLIRVGQASHIRPANFIELTGFTRTSRIELVRRRVVDIAIGISAEH
jgi:hypothetical protein